MTAPAAPSPFDDALAAAALVATDPAGLGGLMIRGGSRALADLVVAELAALLPAGAPVRRLPNRIDEDRLCGGLDLAATLAAGRPVHGRGLLAEANGGLLVVPMAERLAPGTAATLAATLDDGEAPAARTPGAREAARFAVVALDEGVGDDPAPAPALAGRLALRVDLDRVRLADACPGEPADVEVARKRLASVTLADAALEALAEAAAALGVPSPRALIQAAAAARAAAALAGRVEVADEDLALAARLVLGPRATVIPLAEPPPAPPPPREEPENDTSGAEEDGAERGAMADVVLEAARAAIPPALLALASAGAPARGARSHDGRGARDRASGRGGRPVRSRPGRPVDGARLDLLETLRAAAPMQRLRPPPPAGGAVSVRVGDLRVRRFRRKSRTTTVFVVDASGSSALNRLAEAKGAVELVLADCYVRRDRVALIAFRGRSAETILPPTASLTRARRLLADLPAGGGTPLAAAVDAASALAAAVRGHGETPLLVFLTDGQANVGRDGSGGRPQAEADALASAAVARGLGLSSLVLDIAQRSDPRTRRFAEALGATYLPLPRADAGRLASAVRLAAPGRGT